MSNAVLYCRISVILSFHVVKDNSLLLWIVVVKMKDVLNKSTWDRPYAMQSWGSLVAVLFCSIVFFAAYGGTSWWVQYYNRPDGQISIDHISFGLFRLCIRGDCAIDMTNKRLVKNSIFLPQGMIYHQRQCSRDCIDEM